MKLLSLTSRKKVNEEKWKEPESLVSHHQTDQHMHYWVPGIEEGEKGAERIFKDIMAENLPNLMKDI